MRILLLAGEESGVMYAERIRKELLRTHPESEFRGYGDYGFKTADMAVMGIGQVLRKIFYFLRVKRTMERAIDEWRPDVVCTVDYPGMNLKLAAYAKSRGIRAVHVVCPQVWAWHHGRIPKIEASLDRLCCFLPFEPALFKPGFAEFVGHPLLDDFPDVGSAAGRDGKLLAILPGSRIGEIDKHMPTLLKVVSILKSKLPELQVVIPAANDRAFERISSFVCGTDGVVVKRGGARELLQVADAAVVASGTATLEAAIANCPTVLVYKVGWFFAMVARRVIKGVRHVGLANVIAEKAGAPCPTPECLQENFTPDNVIGHLEPWLTQEAANTAARRSLADTVGMLKSDGSAIAKIAQNLV